MGNLFSDDRETSQPVFYSILNGIMGFQTSGCEQKLRTIDRCDLCIIPKWIGGIELGRGNGGLQQGTAADFRTGLSVVDLVHGSCVGSVGMSKIRFVLGFSSKSQTQWKIVHGTRKRKISHILKSATKPKNLATSTIFSISGTKFSVTLQWNEISKLNFATFKISLKYAVGRKIILKN